MEKNPYDTLPRVLSEEEIDMYIKGDRREIDRLILFGLNRLAAVVIPHAQREDARDKEWDEALESLGGIKVIKARADFVDSLIARNNMKVQMMERVSQSAVTWALIAFLGFLAVATWNEIVAFIKSGLMR